MYNIFQQVKANRCKPNITDESVVEFLNGSYEKNLYNEILKDTNLSGKKVKNKQLQGIRAIEVSYKSTHVDIIFAKQYQEGVPCYTHKNGLKPFLWAKKINQKTFYSHNIVVLDDTKVSDTHVLLPHHTNPSEIDGYNIRILKKSVDEQGNHKYYVRYKIESDSEWSRIVEAKRKIYGIDFEQQLTSFDMPLVKRMNDGFKYKITIKNQSEDPQISNNPYFDGKIKGNFNNLLDFFKEGGISPRGTIYLDEKKLRDYLDSVSNDKEHIINLYLGLYRYRNYFNPFTSESANWDKIIQILKQLTPSIAFRINKSYVNKLIEENPTQFLDKIKKSSLYSEDIFNISLDDDKLIEYLIECYTFDGQKESKDVVKYLEGLGIDIFDVRQNQLFFVNPREQYMIQTGRRLFKGIENYEDLDILTFDIETKAQPQYIGMETAALSGDYGRVFQIGIGDNKGYSQVLYCDNEVEERAAIEKTYQIIAERDPDILLTYYGESFDFTFLERRLELLGCVAEESFSKKKTTAQYIRNLVKPFYELYGKGDYIYQFYSRNENSMVKIGGATEQYTQTKMFGKNLCDVLFAVKRAAAIDTAIPNFKLKDNIIHANLASENRVYVKGDMIGTIDSDIRPYYFNPKTGKYFVSKKEINFQYITKYDKSLLREGVDGKYYDNINKLYLFSKDVQPYLKNCTNTFEINTSNDITIDSIDKNFDEFYKKSLEFQVIVCPIEIIDKKNTNNITNQIKNQDLCNYLSEKFKDIRVNFEDIQLIHQKFLGCDEKIKGLVKNWEDFEKVSGSYIIKRYLEDDIEEPYLLDKLYSQSTFEISKWLPTSYEKIATMGNANVWKLILATWSYINCIAIPNYEEPRKFTGGLVGMIASGYHKNIVKIDYSSLYPSEFLQHVKQPDIDITGIYKMLVKFGLYTRLDYKERKNKAKEDGDSKMERYYDKKQLPLKILINSFYGMLGAPDVSPFCHIDSAWHITCSGRQHMRHLIHYFEPKGFKIIYFHTDGANFVIPEGVNEYKYVGKGDNWLVKKDVEYKGVEAYVAEYNDTFMRGRMGVDIDEYCISCVNFAKANFSFLKEKKGKEIISHVGGTLVNKRQSNYIKTFLSKNLLKYFKGESRNFVESYYDYVLKIYNNELPAGEVCSKARVKKTLEDYAKGRKEGKYAVQAHMELAILNNLKVDIDDWIYYINIGKDLKDKGDSTSINISVGQFTFKTKAKAEEMMKYLKMYVENRKVIVEKMYELKPNAILLADELKSEIPRQGLISRIREQGYFEFKNKSEKVNDPTSKAKTFKTSNEVLLNSIDDYSKIKFKITKKETKRHGIQFNLEVILSDSYLNVKLVEKEELDAKIKYNAAKYIAKFNQAVSALWIVFHPDVRKKIPTPNKSKNTGEDYDREANQRGWFMDEELEMVSGYPLEGKEDKQQDLANIMLITEDEMELWKLLGLSPNNSFDYSEISYDGTYYINESNKISKEYKEGFDRVMTGEELAHWLTDKIILDINNKPYEFV